MPCMPCMALWVVGLYVTKGCDKTCRTQKIHTVFSCDAICRTVAEHEGS